jgi:hypothetical protein
MTPFQGEHDGPPESDDYASSLLSLMTEDERMCLMRCSVVRKFDEPLFSGFFSSGNVGLTDLVDNGWIDTDKTRDQRYWVTEDLRAAAWNLWWPQGSDRAVPTPPLRELSARVAPYCGRRDWRIEQLRQAAIADDAEAVRLFAWFFRDADKRFDLAYCQDLIDALTEEERANVIPQELRDRRDAAQARLTTRVMRDSDFYQTRKGRFQPREGAQKALRALLGPDPGHWLLQLHGLGGIGKTTLLRWFVSRACVPDDRTVPAAIINCDDYDAGTILSQPWLLLVKAADQLNGQFPHAPFRDLTRDYRDGSTTDAVTGEPPSPERIGREIEDSFCSNVPNSAAPLVIALDGLDFISLESRAAPEYLVNLIKLLRRVHDRISGLRVVLSGRDDLSGLVPELGGERAVEIGARKFKVRNFVKSETAEYLSHRKVKDADKIDAIQLKSDGVPMLVSLYADWVAPDDTITADDIIKNSKPQVSYLVTRILTRIYNPVVRYSLLYSVTAPPSPALNFEFFRKVLLEAWREPTSGEDSPCALDMGKLPEPKDVPDPGNIAEHDQLWTTIVRCAEQAKWITVADDGDGGKVVKVHVDVRPELLAQLRTDATFLHIHRRAAEHYQARAETAAVAGLAGELHGADWPTLTARVLYHRIQQDDPSAIEYWRGAVRRSRELSRAEWIHSIAGSVTRQPDFREATALSVLPPGTPPPPAPAALPDLAVLLSVLYDCHVELARIAAQDAGLLPSRETATGASALSFSTASTDTAAAIRKGAAQRGIEIGRADYESIVAAINALAGKAPTREKYVRALRELSVTDVSRPDGPTADSQTAIGDVWLIRARAYAGLLHEDGPAVPGQGLSTALDAFGAALRAHRAVPSAVTYVAVDAAQWLLDIDRPDLAIEWCERSDSEWRTAHPAGTAAELKARALLALGRPSAALMVLSPPSGQVTLNACSLAMAANLALYRPIQAVMEYQAPSKPDDPPDNRIEHELLRAAAARELLDPDLAEASFGRAQEGMLLLGQVHVGLQARINTAQALFELRATGNIQRARVYLKDEFDATSVGEAAWARYQLARAELADRQNHSGQVLAIVEEVLQRLHEVEAPPSARVRAAITGLTARSIGQRERQNYLQLLVSGLAAVAPPARVAMLAGLAHCPPIGGEDADRHPLAGRLRELIPPEQEDPGIPATIDERTDLAWRRLITSQVLRVAGMADEAAQLREQAIEGLGADPFVHWRIAAARPEERREPDDPPVIAPDAVLPSPFTFRDHYDRYPVLIAAYTEEWFSRQARRYDDSVYSWLDKAAKSLEQSPWIRSTAWHARLYEAIAAVKRPYRPKAHPRHADADKIWIALGAKTLQHAGRPATGATIPPATGEAIISGVEDGTQRGRRVHVYRALPGDEEPPAHADIDVARFPFDIDRTVFDWATPLGGALSPVLGALRDSNVRLDLHHPVLAALPWELVMTGGAPLAAHKEMGFVFRTASSTLNAQHTQRVRQQVMGTSRLDNPVTSEEWREAMSALRERHASGARRPLRVRLIHPMVGGSLDSERRFGERRRELERFYRASFAADASDGPRLDLQTLYGSQVSALCGSPRDYNDLGSHDGADVVHVCTVMEATEQMPILDLEIADGPPLTARQVDLVVQRLTPPGGLPPLVVLDVFAPPSPVEARRQLRMRNRFAQQLLTLGSVGTVIATGLVTPRASHHQWDLLAQGLADGRTAARICQNIQRHILDAPERAATRDEAADAHSIAFTATALFTSVHPDRLVPPGLLS